MTDVRFSVRTLKIFVFVSLAQNYFLQDNPGYCSFYGVMKCFQQGFQFHLTKKFVQTTMSPSTYLGMILWSLIFLRFAISHCIFLHASPPVLKCPVSSFFPHQSTVALFAPPCCQCHQKNKQTKQQQKRKKQRKTKTRTPTEIFHPDPSRCLPECLDMDTQTQCSINKVISQHHIYNLVIFVNHTGAGQLTVTTKPVTFVLDISACGPVSFS